MTAEKSRSMDASSTASGSPVRELVMTRILDAPCELVFKVWTSPEHLRGGGDRTGSPTPVARPTRGPAVPSGST